MMRPRPGVYTLFLVIAIGFSSCLKKELPVPVHQSGNVSAAAVDMDPTYKYQLYYNLASNSVVGKNLKTAWDLGFEPSAEGYRAVLNGAKSMFVMQTGKTDFASVSASDTAGFSVQRKWDSYTGSYDSTAIGDWRNDKKVYVVDRGFNEMGQHLGFAKLQLLAVSTSAYTVRFGNLTGLGDTTLNITKDTSYNLVFVSFTDKKQVMVEPPKSEWDLQFSQYTYTFYSETPVTPYLVTGCLLNRNGTSAYLDTTGFTSINFASVKPERFFPDISSIGYTWKVFNGNSYAIVPKYSYVIRTAAGVLYKLHFTGFYNSSGIKGYPQWEYQAL